MQLKDLLALDRDELLSLVMSNEFMAIEEEDECCCDDCWEVECEC